MGKRKLRPFADEVGLTEKRIVDIEKKASPDGMHDSTLYGIAKALEMTVDELDHAWRITPAPKPNLRGRRGAAPLIKITGRHVDVTLDDETAGMLHRAAEIVGQELGEFVTVGLRNLADRNLAADGEVFKPRVASDAAINPPRRQTPASSGRGRAKHN